MSKVLTSSFFNRPTLTVCRQLVGKFLVRRLRGKNQAYLITEVEAYDGPTDKASHAHRGKTRRNEVMFGEASRFYVYFTYGMHWMLNVVAGPKNYPAAILIRGVSGINGPARLTKALAIDRKLNGKKAVPSSGLWFEDGGVHVPDKYLKRTPRVGVNYAGAWAKKCYRFVVES